MQFESSPPGQVSPRAQLLSGELTRTVEEFRRRYPDTADRDVHQALDLLARAGASRPRAWSVALLLGVAVLFGAGLLSLILGNASVGRSEVLVVVSALALIALTSVLVSTVRRR